MNQKDFIEWIAKYADRKVILKYPARIDKSAIRPCIEYCFFIWSIASAIYAKVHDMIQKRIWNILSPELASRTQTFSYCSNVVSQNLF